MQYPKFTFHRVLITISLVVAFMFVITLIIDDIFINKEIDASIIKEAENLETQVDSILEEEIGENIEDLSLLAEYISKTNISYSEAVSFFNSQSQSEEFESLYYIDKNGQGISKENVKKDFTQNTGFLIAMENEFAISEPYVTSNENVIAMAVPIIDENEVIGVLLSEYLVEDFFGAIIEVIEKDAHALIIDGENQVIFSTDSAYHNINLEKKEELKIFDNEKYIESKEEVKQRKNGYVSYILNGKEKLAFYSSIEQSPWMMVLYFDKNKVNETLSAALDSIISVIILVIVILIIFIIYIWQTKINAIKSIEDRLYYDSLTGLPNLIKLKKDMHEILNKNKNKKYGIIKFDIENFKVINHLFGFEIGNEVLRTFKTIRETVDEPSLIIARTGNDEFMIFSGNGFTENMETRTDIYEGMYNQIIPELRDYRISFKYGRYAINLGEVDVDGIINKVTIAHTISKQQKGKIIFDYDTNYESQILEESRISSKMRLALENKEFNVFLQPKVNVNNNKIIGLEALCRWIEPNGNMVMPLQFISVFEKNAFIIELDKYMLHETCKIIKNWIDKGEKIIPISVNFSGLDLNNPNFVKEISEIVDKYNVPHEYIEIELTESTMVNNQEILEELFHDLHNLNFKVSMDDFGSGFSSLGLLKSLKVDTIKLDKSFFSSKKDLDRAKIVIQGIINMAKDLNIRVIAEGIEIEGQVKYLKQVGCRAAQGFFFAKPMSVSEFEKTCQKDIE